MFPSSCYICKMVLNLERKDLSHQSSILEKEDELTFDWKFLECAYFKRK